MENKNRLLAVLKYLWEYTDEDHTASLADITRYLEDNGITVTRKTLTNDIHDLMAFGIDIISNRSARNQYFIGNRGLDYAEVKFLVDTAEASRFLSRRKTAQITGELQHFVSVYQAKELKHPLNNATRKSKNEMVLINVDRLFAAIAAGHKVKFRLRRYTQEKEAGFANAGEFYYFSPYELLYSGDYYYVVGYSEKHGGLGQFRVDRMMELKDVEQPGIPAPDKETLERHISSLFSMFNGEQSEVELYCEAAMMDYVMERFGEEVRTSPVDPEHFSATVQVELSPLFYSWVVGFGGKIQIKGPDKAVEEMRELLQRFL